MELSIDQSKNLNNISILHNNTHQKHYIININFVSNKQRIEII